MDKRRRKAVVFLCGLCVGYLAWVRLTGLAIPCLFRKVTGWRCPGCGITTLLVSLSKLDFKGAFSANPFLFVTLPLLAAQLLYSGIVWYRGRNLPRWDTYLAAAYCGALCVFGVVRNLI